MRGISVRSFLVSNNNKKNDVIPVVPFDEFVSINPPRDGVILVAVSQIYWSEIEGLLDRVESCESYFITREDVCNITRLLYPVDCCRVLSTSNPVSRLFGCDRGKAIDRYYIEKYLLEWKERANINPKKTFEVGDDSYSKWLFSDAENDILDYSNGMDLTKPETLPNGKYDVFICTQVFNFIFDIKSAIRGAYGVLNNNGWLVGTVAGNISPVSVSDMNNYGDYWRFTYLSVRRLLEEVFNSHVKVMPYGNAFSATAFVQGMSEEDLTSEQHELLAVNEREYSIVIGFECQKVE